jgi:putative ABC transport system ATP-binding protein
MTALENVQLITEIASKPMPAEDALQIVGPQDRRGHFPSQLSGGEQQRVAIARAIAKQPDVLASLTPRKIVNGNACECGVMVDTRNIAGLAPVFFLFFRKLWGEDS